MILDVLEALAPRAGNGENACSLSSYFCILVFEICLLTGTSTLISETGWSLQPLKACICLLKQQNDGSNSVTSNANELKMLSLGCASNEDAQFQCDSKQSFCTLSCWRITDRARPELPSCQVAK